MWSRSILTLCWEIWAHTTSPAAGLTVSQISVIDEIFEGKKAENLAVLPGGQVWAQSKTRPPNFFVNIFFFWIFPLLHPPPFLLICEENFKLNFQALWAPGLNLSLKLMSVLESNTMQSERLGTEELTSTLYALWLIYFHVAWMLLDVRSPLNVILEDLFWFSLGWKKFPFPAPGPTCSNWVLIWTTVPIQVHPCHIYHLQRSQ